MIEKRGKQIYYRFKFRGKDHRKPTGLVVSDSDPTAPITERLRKAALEIEKRAKAELLVRKKQENVVTDKPFRDAADDFLDWCETTEYRSQTSTYKRIRVSFSSLRLFFKKMSVADIRDVEVEKYKTFRITENGVKDVTLRHDLYALSIFFKRFAMKRQWALSNPVLEVSKPSDKDAVREHILDADEERAYFDTAAALNRNLHDAAMLILLQGCRPEEIFAINKADVFLDDMKLKIPGGKTRAARRTLDLTPEAVEILRARMPGEFRWVFPSPIRKGRHIVKMNNAHDQVCLEGRVSFHLYDLRHTFATRLLETGTDIAAVAAILGHSSLRSVYRYLHPQAASKKDAMKRYAESREALRSGGQNGGQMPKKVHIMGKTG